MTVFSFVHGGQQGAWCFEPLIAELDRRGYESIAVDLPIDDPTPGRPATPTPSSRRSRPPVMM